MSAPLAGARVLLVGGFPPPYGGIAVHVQALRAALAREGAEVTVLDLGSRKPAAPGVVPVAGPLGLAAQLASHAAAGWLVHAHVSGHTPKSWLVALAAALSRRPLGSRPLLTLHSGLVPNWLALGEGQRRLARAVAASCGRVIAVSPAVARALVEAGVRPERVAVVPAFTGIEPVGEPPLALEEARARFAPLLSCAVAESPIYGLRVLLPALGLLSLRRPGVGAVLFGPVGAERVAALARASGVSGRVRCLGQLSHPSALAVLAGSDCFVRPTLADGDALSVREALSLGTRVVASAVGTRPEGVRLFRAGDALDLAARLEQALDSPAPQSRPEQGLERVLAIYREELRGRVRAA